MIAVYKTDIREISEADYKATYNLLSSVYKEKCNSFSDERRIKQTLAGQLLLAKGIKENFSVTDFNIYLSQNGKPLTDCCYFSISHTENLVVCAVSDSPVGIDAEILRPIPQRNKYKLFTLSENDYVNSSKDNLSGRFFEIWTKKEAYIKMKDLKLFEVFKLNTLTESPNFSFSTECNGKYIITICRPFSSPLPKTEL